MNNSLSESLRIILNLVVFLVDKVFSMLILFCCKNSLKVKSSPYLVARLTSNFWFLAVKEQ